MKRQEGETLRGSKFYRNYNDDEVELLRVIDVDSDIAGDAILICSSDLDETGKITISGNDLISKYTRISPDGMIGFAIAKMKSGGNTWYEDVVIAVYTSEDIYRNLKYPSMVCRQNVMDLMYTISSGKEDHDYVGCCMTYEDMPPQIGFDAFSRTDEILTYKGINYYISDTVDDILTCLGQTTVNKFNKSLEKDFQIYIKSIHGMDVGQEQTKGHCRTLKALMENNNFQYQFDSLYSIFTTKLSIADNIVEKDGCEYLSDDIVEILSDLFQKRFRSAIAIKYDHDIDMSKINKNDLIMLRDKTGVLYLIRLVGIGEYLKQELDKERFSAASVFLNLNNKYSTIMGSKNKK